jgi:DNA processing protein
MCDDQNTGDLVGEYAACIEICKASTTKRRQLDSFTLKLGIRSGIRTFLQRQSIIPESILDRARLFAEKFAEHDDVHAVSVSTPNYPQRLQTIPSPPAFLFYVGDILVLRKRCVAVVGTRGASDAGLSLASQVASELAEVGVVVVSGLARGVDAAAHQAALRVGDGLTAAVIGTPSDRYYPAEHRQLQDRVAASGVVVSHFPIGTKTSPYSFPERNRIMAGLCDATVVVEAGDTSGAAIQARQCMSQGRTLFMTSLVQKAEGLKWPRTYLGRGARVANSAKEIITALDRM